MLQYDELEASFYQVLKEKNLSWFGTLITPGPKDDSAPLLSISKKSYRDLILANTISVFDFRVYLLARQCELLAKMGSVTEVCKKVGAFLGAFGRRLREIEVTINPYFTDTALILFRQLYPNFSSNPGHIHPLLASLNNVIRGPLLTHHA